MTGLQVLTLLGAGLAAAGGQFGITAAYYHAPAKEISIYDYSQIIFATTLGFLLFDQVPDKYSLLGYVIICAMALWMFLYNKKRDALAETQLPGDVEPSDQAEHHNNEELPNSSAKSQPKATQSNTK